MIHLTWATLLHRTYVVHGKVTYISSIHYALPYHDVPLRMYIYYVARDAYT